eukprot:Skav214172  [mRNA]  locus=scaffold945:291383:291667:+ [translate_table: standard]
MARTPAGLQSSCWPPLPCAQTRASQRLPSLGAATGVRFEGVAAEALGVFKGVDGPGASRRGVREGLLWARQVQPEAFGHKQCLRINESPTPAVY